MADEATLYEMIGRQTVALAEARAQITEMERIIAALQAGSDNGEVSPGSMAPGRTPLGREAGS